MVERGRRDRCDGGCHHTARAEPGREEPLAQREVGSARAPQHADRPHDERQRSDGRHAGPTEVHDGFEPHVGREQHEQHADQPERQLLLELADDARALRREIREHGRRDDDREDSALRENRFADRKARQRAAEDHEVFEPGRNDARPTKEQGQRAADRRPGPSSECQAHHETERAVGEASQRPLDDDLDRDGGDHRADRVDQEPFRLEHGGQAIAHGDERAGAGAPPSDP